MKLKTYNLQTLSPELGKIIKPTLSLYDSSIGFNEGAKHAMKIAPDMAVQFHQDEDRPADWYIEVCNPDTGFCLRLKSRSKTSSGLTFGHKRLTELIRSSINPNLKGTIRIPIGPKDKNGFYPLITKAAREWGGK